MRLFLPKCLGITLLLCLYSIFLSAQTGPAGVNSGAVLWLDASDVTAGGTAPTIGSTVSTWSDKSGSAHNATSTGTNTAIYTSGGANSLPVIHFNRTSSAAGTGFTVSGLDIRAITSPEVTIFAVYRQGTNDGNNQAVWGNDNGSQQRFFNSKWSTGATDGSLSTGGTASVITGASTVGETRLVTGVYSGNASAAYINGNKVSTFNDLTAASSGQSVFKIGSDGDNNYFNGDVSEIIVYNRKLTDCELETVNRYLADKYGIDFSNIGSYYSLGSPIDNNINGIGKPASACAGNPLITSAISGIAMISNPSSVSAGAVMTFANDGTGYDPYIQTPPAYTSRLTQRWRVDLTGIVGTVDICFNLEGLGIDVSNSANFALLVDKDGNFSDAAVVNTGVSVFGDRVCISGVSLTKGDYFSLATKAEATVASSVTSPNEGKFLKSAFTTATVIDNQILVKGSNSITNGKVYIDTGFVANDLIAWGALPTGVTGNYSTATGVATFTGTATAAQWQAFYRTVTFRTTSGNLSDRVIRFVLGNVVTFTVGSSPHYYELVTNTVNWTTAKATAATKTLYGLQGYLATVTSQAENDYIRAKLASAGWIGASCNMAQVNSVKGANFYTTQTAADGHYFWITGPEAGNAISNGLNNPVAAPGAYMFWNNGEPNNSNGTNEQYVQLNTLKWNDLPLTSTLGYVIEYGGYPTDSMMNIDYSRVLKNAPAGPVFTTIATDGGSSTTDKITNDRTLNISGTSPNSATITIYQDDVQVGTATASNAGAWTFNYTGTTLDDGTYNFTAEATVSSVVSALSTVFQVVIDGTAPAKPGTPALTIGALPAINNKTPTFTGSAEPGSVVTLYDGATSRGTATADATGKWTITSPTLTEASHNMSVKATDVAGNTSVSSDIYVLRVDVTAPAKPGTPTLVGGVAGVVNTATPTIKGTAEASSMVLIYQDGTLIDSVAADATGNYTYTFVTALPDATYAITVKARDAATNLSVASNALSIKVDTTPPATPPAPTLVGGNGSYINNNKPTIKGTADANSVVIIFNNGVAVDSVSANAAGNYTYTPSVAAPDGTYIVTVKAKDAVGNVSDMSPSLTVIIDTGVPITPTVPVLVGGNNGSINSSTPTISGAAEANSKVYIYKNGVVLDSVIADASGNYIYTFLVSLPDATYSIAVKDKDAAGNISAMSPVLVMKVDTSAPAAPTAPVKVSGNDKPVINGVAEANSTVIIFKGGVAVDSVTANASGNYTYTFVTALPDGPYAITVKAKDAAGNVSAASPALNIIVDTVAPATPAAPVKVSGNNKPVISGTAEANATVTIYRDGVSVGTATADASGNYTYTFTVALADGAHAITVTATDMAGNVSGVSPALNITVDTAAPATPAAPVKVSGNAKPVISGTAEANSTVTIYRDGVSVGTTTADASGNYTYTFVTNLTDGAHAITVTATDATGNVSGVSPALNITVDTAAPATPAAPIKVSGNAKPVISGTAEANSTVTIYRDGVSVGTTTADASGNYTYTFTVALTDGSHAITVTATDAAGNVSGVSPALTVTVDTVAPVTPAAPIKVSGNDKPVISGTAEINSTVTIYSDGVYVGTVAVSPVGSYTYTFTSSLADGPHAITVTATDVAGNVSGVSPALNIIVDTAAPATPGAPVKVSGNDKPVISGTAEANSTVTIYRDGVSVGTTTSDASGNYTYTFTVALSDGSHAITVTSTDATGNVSGVSPALNITVDTAAPATPAAPVKVSGNDKPVISGTAEANSTVTIYRDGVSVGTTTADATGNYTYTFVTSLTDGSHAITVTSTDATGNVSGVSPALNITVDTAAPATPGVPVLVGGNGGRINDATPDIKGTAEANSTVTIYRDGVSVGTTTADATGNYTYTFTVALSDGSHAITVTSTDATGNVSGVSPALNITVDTAAPVTPAAPIKVSGNDKPVISGTAEANSTVTIYRDGVSVGTTTADATGNYTYTFTVALSDGSHAITVTSTDATGNVSGVSPALNITVDTVVPATPAAPVKVSGNDKPVISGTAEVNSTVTIYRDGVSVGTTTADASGNYTYTFTTSLTDGSHAITVTATDATGNVSGVSPALNITVDTAAPATPAGPVKVSGNDKPVISGTAEANSTVTIYRDGVSVGTTTADASGNYTYTFVTSLTDGSHAITVTSTDATGNVSGVSPALNITVDTAAPSTPAAPVKVSGNDKPVISGTAEANSTVTIYSDGVSVGTTTADATGNYTYTFTTSLSDGSHAITVTSTDATGNVSGVSPALNITVDTAAPTTPAAPVKVSGNDKPVISGTAEANSTVTIYSDGVSVGTTTADASGNYTYTFTVALSDGSHAITVTSTDATGNVSGVSPALTVTVDTAAPSTPGAPVKVSGNDKPVISGTAEANSTVTIYRDGVSVGTTTADASGNYTYTFVTSLTDGSHAITVTSTDATGNVSGVSPALNITVDTVAPATPAAPVKVSGNDKPVISGTAEANSTVTIYSDGVSVGTTTADASGNYTYTFTTSLSDGSHTITVTSTDATGNVSGVSPALTVTVDTAAPSTPAAPVKVSGNDKPVISGTAEANSTVTIYSDGVSVGTTTADATGNYTYTFTVALSDGSHAITVTSTDATGNVSGVSPALNITVDTAAPSTPGAPIKVSGNDKPVISGTAEANSTVTIYSDGVSVGTTTADATGNYTYTFTTSLSDGSHAITVTSTDATGNVSGVSPALNITVDTIKPSTPAAPVKVSGNDKPVISGTAEANSTVTIYSDGVSVGTTTADASGNYTYTFTTSLTDGSHAITVTSTDATGNVSGTSPALNITVDTTKPSTPAAPIKVSGNDKPVISGTAEANSTVTIYSDGVSVGTTTADATGNYTYTFTVALPDGSHAITVTSTDATGNVSGVSPALNINVDTTAPSTPGAPVKVSGNDKPVINGTAEANSTVTIYSDGVSVGTTTADATGNYTYTFTTSLSDGSHAITVTSTDATGNVSGTSPALNITVDTIKPFTPAAPVKVSGNDKPVISGTAEANSTVTIYSDGVSVGTTTADASGNYTYTFTTSLTDGSHAITVTSTDATGNVSGTSPALNITVDTTKPSTPAAPIKVSGNDKPVISGTAEANSTVTIYSDGVSVGTTTADASGNYTYTFTTSLTDGAHAITVTSTDATGNVSATSPALNINVDTTAPTTPAAPVLVGGNNGVINNNKPTIKGTAEANTTVIIFNGGVAIDSVTTNATGNYTYTFVTALADGTYSITVKDKDATGNVSAASPALSIKVDTQTPATPTVPVLVGGINGFINDATPDIKGKAEANSTVTIYSDGVSVGTTTADATGNYTYTFTTSLTDGPHAITVKATDAAGNVSAASPALNITVDTSKPSAPAAPILVGGINNVTKDATPDIKGSADMNSTINIYLDGVWVGLTTTDATGNYAYTFITTLTDGAHAITITATDAAGNVSVFSPALNIKVDTQAPATPAVPILVGGNNGVVNTSKPTIRGIAEANATVIIYKGGIVIDSVTADATGNYVYTFATALADGTYSVTVKVKDAAANISAMSPALSITVDTSIPGTPAAPLLVGANNNVTSDATPGITGKAEPNSIVTIYLDGVNIGTATADASGNYTYTFTTDITDGTHAITVTATDTSGNVSGMSPALNVTIDSHAPATPPAPVLVGGTNNKTTDPTPDIKGTAEANSTVTIYSDNVKAGTATVNASGNYTFTFTDQLMDGTRTITVTATDAAGNVSAMSPALSIIIDAHAPGKPTAPVLVSGKNNITNDATPDISGKAEANSTVIVYTDGVVVGSTTVDASGNYTYTYSVALEDGSHTVTVTATDASGNVSPMSPELTFSVDTHAPGTPTAPVLVGGNDNLTNNTTPTVTGKSEPNSIVTVYVDGVAAGTAQVDANGNYTFTFTVPMSDGPHAITARATDQAGNSSENASPALNIIIDTKPPATPNTPVLVDEIIDGVVPNGKPTVKGVADKNTTIIIYDNGVAVGTAKADSTGKWMYTFDPAISNADHAITVTAIDAAGNISPLSPALNFTVDAHTPDVPLPPRLPGVNGKTNSTTPAITGQGEPGTRITIYTDGVKSGTAIVDANGNWTYTYNPPLSESAHNIYVTASKADGSYESGHSETVVLTISLSGPTVVLTSNASAGSIVNSTLTVTVTFSEAVTGFSWDDVDITNGKVSGFTQVSSGIYQVQVTSTENGVVTVAIPAASAIDVIGNGNKASELLAINMRPTVGIDQVYPMPATDFINVRMTGIGTGPANATMTNMAGQVLLNQPVTVKNGAFGLNVQRLPGGTYVLLVRVKDESYNVTIVIAR